MNTVSPIFSQSTVADLRRWPHSIARLCAVAGLSCAACLIPAARAGTVDIAGGFTQYFGPLERPSGPPGSSLDRQTTFSIPGYSFAASPYEAYPDLPGYWSVGIGAGNAGFVSGVVETQPAIDFYFNTPSGPQTRNSISFTPTTGANVNVGDLFKLGTFTFTNGGWLGGDGLPDSFFVMALRTVSADPDLNGHDLITYLGLHVTTGYSPDSSAYSADPVDNADYIYLDSDPFHTLDSDPFPTFGSLAIIGYAGVYEAEPALQPPGGSNTGSVDLYGKIGSLIPTGFANPQGGAILRSSIPVVANDVVANTVPEPASWALLLAGSGIVSAVARRRRKG